MKKFKFSKQQFPNSTDALRKISSFFLSTSNFFYFYFQNEYIMQNTKAQYTKGSIQKTIIKSAFPMLAATIAISGYNVVDTYYVSQLGKRHLAAIGFTFPIIMLVNCIYNGLSHGILTTVAHALGNNNQQRAVKMAMAGLFLKFLCALFISAIGYFSTDFIFIHCGATEDTLPLIHEYMNIWFWGSFSMALAMCGNSLLLASGDTKWASSMMLFGMGLNVILDPIFIFGYYGFPPLGMQGAALATVLSQFLSFVGKFIVLKYKHQLISFRVLSWRYLRICWPAILKIALPSALGMIILPVGAFIRTRMIASFGEIAIAACAAAGRIEVVAFIFPMAVGMPLMSMVAQNYGAKLYQRILDCHTFTMGFAFIYEFFMAILYWIFAPFAAKLFSTDPQVIAIIVVYLRIIPFGFGLFEMHRYSTFFFTGCNHPNRSAFLHIFRISLLVFFTFIAQQLRWLNGIFYAHLLTDFITGTLGFLWTRHFIHQLLQKQQVYAKNKDS